MLWYTYLYLLDANRGPDMTLSRAKWRSLFSRCSPSREIGLHFLLGAGIPPTPWFRKPTPPRGSHRTSEDVQACQHPRLARKQRPNDVPLPDASKCTAFPCPSANPNQPLLIANKFSIQMPPFQSVLTTNTLIAIMQEHILSAPCQSRHPIGLAGTHPEHGLI